jgi:ribosomal protein S18 acetylase RimI-like enzyme
LDTIRQPKDYEIAKVAFPDRNSFWKHHERLACYFTGASSILTEEDSDEKIDRYLVTKNDKVVACFCVRESIITDIAYERTKKGIETHLLDFLVDNWIQLMRAKSGDQTKKIRLLFPSLDQKQVEQFGFHPQSPHKRDRMTLMLSDWKQEEWREHSLIIRQTNMEDVESVTRIYVDAYQGTIDEQMFSPDGMNYDDELENFSSFLKNQSKGYPIIESASVVAILEQEIVGFCYTCNWRGLPLIWDFAVSKKHQGKGIGRSLLESVLTKLEMEGYERVALFVTQGNVEAQKIYDSLGFAADSCTLRVLEREV